MGIFSKKSKVEAVSSDPKVAKAIEETQRLMREARAKDPVNQPYPSLYDRDAPERVAAILEAEKKRKSPLVMAAQTKSDLNQKPGWDKDKKRFVVLLVMAAWIVIAGFVSYSNYAYYLANAIWYAVFQFFVYSLPVVLFGGVLFWWFGRETK